MAPIVVGAGAITGAMRRLLRRLRGVGAGVDEGAEVGEEAPRDTRPEGLARGLARDRESSLAGPRRELGFLLDATLGAYAQLVFARRRVVGAILLSATLLSPRVGLGGLAAVLLATVAARGLRFPEASVRSGYYGYNALLVGLGAASLLVATPMGLGLAGVAVLASVLLTAAATSTLTEKAGLPALAWPFLLAFWALTAVAPLADVPLHGLAPDPSAAAGVPPVLALFLRSLGGLLFLPRLDVGLLLLGALLIHSRIGSLLALLAFGLIAALASELFVLGDPALASVLVLNAMLIAIALGGVFFVPSGSSYLLAIGGVLFGAAVGLGASPFFARAGLPMLILPFHLTLALVLVAMRQRTENRSPVAAIPAGAPEPNLRRQIELETRAPSRYGVRFTAPFLGKWTVTQGVGGSITHRGPWRHALDFEVLGGDGERYAGAGDHIEDYYCYRLPVLAAADGVVAAVVDGVPDNAVGVSNLRENWGNVVILYHGPGLYSCVAHLMPGSIRVREGQAVKRGEQLGRAGSSGRSPVPHLHFQLQGSAAVGAPTLPLALHELVVEDREEPGEERLFAEHLPGLMSTVRALEARPQRAATLTFTHGQSLLFLGEEGARERPVRLWVALDALGSPWIRAQGESGALKQITSPSLTALYSGEEVPGRALTTLLVALPKLPLEGGPRLAWSEVLPLAPLLPAPLRPLLDLAQPFLPRLGLAMEYRAERLGPFLVVRGRSRWALRGRPWVRSYAKIHEREGLHRLGLEIGEELRRMRRIESEAEVDGRELPRFSWPTLRPSG